MSPALTRPAVAAALILVAGCGDVTPVTNNRVAVPGPEATQNRLENLSEGERNAVFIRAIRDSGEDCQFVESSEPVGEHRGHPVWRARCEGGASFTIVVAADGGAQVINDAEARLAGFNETAPVENGQSAEQNAAER